MSLGLFSANPAQTNRADGPFLFSSQISRRNTRRHQLDSPNLLPPLLRLPLGSLSANRTTLLRQNHSSDALSLPDLPFPNLPPLPPPLLPPRSLPTPSTEFPSSPTSLAIFPHIRMEQTSRKSGPGWSQRRGSWRRYTQGSSQDGWKGQNRYGQKRSSVLNGEGKS